MSARGAAVPQYVTLPLEDEEGSLPAWLVRADRTPPVIEPWICRSAQCAGRWTNRRSYAADACSRCGTPRGN